MLGLMKATWVSAALSAGMIAAMPVHEASLLPVSGKQFVDRLGEPETAAQVVRTGSRLVAATTVAGQSKGNRGAAGRPADGATMTVERRQNGASTLIRLPANGAAFSRD